MTRLMPAVLALALAAALSGCGSENKQYLESGKAFLEKNDQAAALIQFKNAVKENPDHAEARYLFARTLRSVGDLAAAETEYRKALSLGYDRALIVPDLGAVLIDLGQPDKALAETLQFPSEDPAAQAEIAALRGEAWLMQGNVVNAKFELDKALSLSPRSPGARVGLARLAFHDGDVEGATRQLEAVVKEFPDNAKAWNAYAGAVLKQGNVPAAADAFDKVIALQPTDMRAYISLVPALLSLKRTDDAAERVSRIAKIAPGAVGTKYLQSLVAYTQGDRVKARELIQQTLKGGPEDGRALLLAGTIDLDLGNYASAEKQLGKVVSMAPRDPQPRYLLATSYVRLGQPEKAKETLAPLLQGEGVTAKTLALQGEIAAALKDPKAVEYFERAVKLQPDDAQLRAQLGAAKLLAGRSQEGMADLQSAAAKLPNASADLVMVEQHLRQKQLPQATAVAQALLRKLPNDPVAHNAMGLVQLASADRAAARASFDKALQLSPAFFPAAKNLASLDLAEGKTEDAMQRYRGVLAKDPSHREAAILLASTMQRSHAPPSEIVGVLDKSIAANPSAVEPRLAKSEYLLATGDGKGALEAVRGAQGLAGEDPKVLFALAKAQQAAGEYTQAAATFGKLGSLMPKSAAPFAGQAEAYAAAKNWPAARTALDRAISLKPDHLPSHLAAVELGIRAGEPERARRDAQAIQKRWPKAGEGYIAEAQVLMGNKDTAGAEAVLREGIARSGSTHAHNRLVGLMIGQKREAEAEKAAVAWMSGHPSDTSAAMFIADAYLAVQKHADAERWYERVIGLAPENPIALNNLAWIKGRLDKADAVPLAKRALAKAPENPVLLDTLGALQVQFGPAEDGVANLRKAAGRLPKSAAVRINLARGLVKIGQKEEAARVLDEASRLSADESVKRDIEAVRKTL